jgi:hypothetical protein
MRGVRGTFVAVGALVALAIGAASAVADDSASIFFDGYALGPVTGQQGWTGGDCTPPTIDEAVVPASDYPDAVPPFGDQLLRVSNAAVSGCYRDAFSPALADEAGEPTALNGGLGGGTREPRFAAQWVFSSSTGGYQPGLNVQISPDRGDGARMSYVGAKMENGAITIVFIDVQGVNGTAPCFQCANFVETDFPGYDPTKSHLIQLEMGFEPGPSNDVVGLFVDGKLVHVGTSWEDYYRYDTESSPTAADRFPRTANRLLIRATGPAAPSTDGQGYLIGDISYVAGRSFGAISTKLEADPILLRLSPLHLYLPIQLTAHLSVLGKPIAGRTIRFTALGGKVCTANTDSSGTATCSLLPSLVPVLATAGLQYTASFDGEGVYEATQDTAPLIK